MNIFLRVFAKKDWNIMKNNKSILIHQTSLFQLGTKGKTRNVVLR